MGLSLVWGSGRPSHWDSVDRGLVPQFWKDPPREGPSRQHCPHSGVLESGGLVSPDLEPGGPCLLMTARTSFAQRRRYCV